MPLIRFDLIEGRDRESIKRLLDVSHEVIVEAFDVPQRSLAKPEAMTKRRSFIRY